MAEEKKRAKEEARKKHALQKMVSELDGAGSIEEPSKGTVSDEDSVDFGGPENGGTLDPASPKNLH